MAGNGEPTCAERSSEQQAFSESNSLQEKQHDRCFGGGRCCVAWRYDAACETDAGVAPVVSGVYGEPGWKRKLPAVGLAETQHQDLVNYLQDAHL